MHHCAIDGVLCGYSAVYVDGPDAGAYMDAISALQRHGAFHAMLATMALPLLCIVIIILFRACFTIRTKSETVLRGIAITFAAFVLLGLLYVATACPCRPASTKRRCWSI